MTNLKILLTILLFVTCLGLKASALRDTITLAIDLNGAVDKNINVPKENINLLYKVDASKFNASMALQQKELVKDFIDRLEITTDSISKSPNNYSFIAKQGLLLRYEKVLDFLKVQYKQNSFPLIDSNLGPLDGIPHLRKSFCAAWDSVTSYMSSSKILKEGSFVFDVYKPVLSNIFFIEYYNNILLDSMNNSQFQKYTKDGYDRKKMRNFKNAIDSLEKYVKSDDFEKSNDWVKIIVNDDFVNLFLEPWVESLLWTTKGNLLLNPFYPKVKEDNIKFQRLSDSLYLNHINELVVKRAYLDTLSDIQQYRSVLDEWEKINLKLSDKNLQDSDNKEYLNNLRKLKTVKIWSNSFKLPAKISRDTIYRFLDARITSKDIPTKNLGLRSKDQIDSWYIHNLTTGQQVSINETGKTKIEADNTFEKEMSNAINQVASVYSSVSSFSNLILYQTITNDNLLGEIPLYKVGTSPKPADIQHAFMVVETKRKRYNTLKNKGSFNPKDLAQLVVDKRNLDRQKDSIMNIGKSILNISKLYHQILCQNNIPLISEKIIGTVSSEPILRTTVISSEKGEELHDYNYKVLAATAKDTIILDAVKYRTNQYSWFSLSAGIAYSFGSPAVQTLQKADNSSISFNSESRSIGMLVAANIYFKPLVRPTNFLPGRENWCRRFFAQVGVRVPDPLENIYFGVGYNFGPGLLLSGGLHFFGQKNYDILNDVVIKERRSYSTAPYISLSIDPTLFVKALGIGSK